MTASNGRPLDSLAVDALGRHERREVEGHLAGCPQCRAELAARHETLAALVAPTLPPPQVWQGVAAAIESVGLPSPIAARPGHTTRPARHLAPAIDTPRRGVVLAALGLAAAAVLAVVAFVAGRPVDGPTGGVEDLPPRPRRLAITVEAAAGATGATGPIVARGTIWLSASSGSRGGTE